MTHPHRPVAHVEICPLAGGPVDGVSLRVSVDEFLSSGRCRNANTRRAYAGTLDRMLAELGEHRPLHCLNDQELAYCLYRLWGARSDATWNRNLAAVRSWLDWSRARFGCAPTLPHNMERRHGGSHTESVPSRAAIEHQLSRRDVPLRERAMWRMLYETAVRTTEILALNIEDLDPAARLATLRRDCAPPKRLYWASGTAELLPLLLRLPDGGARTHGPLFLTHRRPGPGRLPALPDLCPHTGRNRLGYDRARILLKRYTGWEPQQIRRAAAAHLHERHVPPDLVSAKLRSGPHRADDPAIAEITKVLAPLRRVQ
ncbi:site-specific integrase [Thermomonospora umbrina]|uniref:Phage integrase family protein with SAM-like domain n=1 Tax=Thermomonospora umbrina TaxID=111806 RepID=A0A3D9SMK8_9ACTN|nr:site-specific integrase [Thermomonospora umbrina]REE97166.1 phage integrase family protein with SAM-like domain [Thermomonospora umbrina]